MYVYIHICIKLVTPIIIRLCFRGLLIGLIAPSIKNCIGPGKGFILLSCFFVLFFLLEAIVVSSSPLFFFLVCESF